jgi:hypothetical protein
MTLAQRQFVRSLFLNKALLSDCVLYAPLWYQGLSGSGAFQSIATPSAAPLTLTPIGTTWGNRGRTFDGDDSIDVPSFTNYLSVATSFTIIAVVYATSTTGIKYVVGSAVGANDRFVFANTGGTFEAGLYNGADYVAKRSFAMATLTWYHIGYTFTTPATGVMLVNSVVQTGAVLNFSNGSIATKIGAESGLTADRSWIGTIGEVRVYNRVLSSGDMIRDYQNTKWRYS